MTHPINPLACQAREARRGLKPHITHRNQALLEHLGLARLSARRQARRGQEEYDDLLQESSIGVLSGIERFDINRGVQPSSYLISRATGQILHYRRDRATCLRIPWSLRDLAVKSIRLQQQRQAMGLPKLTQAVLAKQLGVSPGRLLQAQEALHAAKLVSLDQAIESTHDQGAWSRLDQLEQPETLQDDQRTWLLRVFNELEPTQQQWLQSYFIERMSLLSMSRCFGVSRAKIKAGLQEAVERLQQWARRDGELMPEAWPGQQRGGSATHSPAHC